MIEAEPRPEVRAERLHDLTTIHPDDSRVWLRLSRAELDLRRFAPAFAALERALCLDLSACEDLPAGAPAFWHERVAVLRTLPRGIAPHERQEVASQIERVLPRYPDLTPLHFNLAVLLAELGRKDEAAARARVALELSPTLLPLFPRAVRDLVRPPAVPPPLPDPLARDHVGRFRVLRVTEVITQHVLYDAVDRDDGRPVTLRRLLTVPAEAARRIFLDQARTSLEAPEVARVLGVVDADDGTPHQILERVRGRSVQRAFASPPHDLDPGVDLVWLIARAVQHLNERDQYVHGQLGPATVIYIDDNLVRPFRLIDVGLHARLQGGGGASLPLLDAPDQVPSNAADVYGIGRLLHYVLTGRLPASGAIDLRNVAPPARDELAAVIGRCLAGDPSRRYGSTGQVADALESLFVHPPASVGPGSSLDDWILVRQLSDAGEFAVVYEAHHRDAPELRAAVKVLRPMYARHREARHRFETEITSTPVHPGVVRMWPRHGGRTAAPHYAMELLIGASLRDHLDGHRADPPLAIAWGVEVAEAMAHAHEQGVIHRDLKPENLFVLAGDNPQRVKVLDFGIAKVRETALHTKLNQRLGTLGYMAPEQLRDQDVSSAVDVYALGMILFEGLVGGHPFDRQCNVPYRTVVPAEALAALDHTLGAAGPQLERLLAVMTAHDPRERPTMPMVAQELRAISRRLEAKTVLADDDIRRPPYAPTVRVRVPDGGSGASGEIIVVPPPPPPDPPKRFPWQAAATLAGAMTLLSSSAWYYGHSSARPACAVSPSWATMKPAELTEHVRALLASGCRDEALAIARARRQRPGANSGSADERELARWLGSIEEAIDR